MNAHCCPLDASETDPAPTGAAQAVLGVQMAMLTRLAEVGMEIAEACGRLATRDAPDADPQAAGLVFARVSRAVRMTIALQSRLMKDLAALDRADDIARTAAKDRRRTRLSLLVSDAARTVVEAQVQAGARRFADEDALEDEIERLSDEAYERLTDAEDGDLQGQSFDEAVARIAKDLGLSPNWSARLHAAVEAPPVKAAGACAMPVSADVVRTGKPRGLRPPDPADGPPRSAPPGTGTPAAADQNPRAGPSSPGSRASGG